MRTPAQQKAINDLFGWKFRLFLLFKLPMGFLAGIRVVKLTDDTSVTSVPFKGLNKNPFRSMYFAVQSMAAELSTAVPCQIAVTGLNPSVAFIIVRNEATYLKKATGKVYFTCEGIRAVQEAVDRCHDGSANEVTLKTVGRMKDGTVVSEFFFTWSFKTRTKS